MTTARYLLAFACVLLLPSLALGQAYPAKPVRMIIPFPPGGPTDLMGRMAADRLSRAWGVQVIPDNRGGAGGNIGFELCAKSPPDGYTVCMMTVAQSISPGIYRKLGYDLGKDFSYVTLMAILPSLLTTHPSLPAKNVKDVIALAKARPGQIIYASTGNGTSPHMLMEMFKWMAGVNMVHVPYKGQAQSVIDQISGQIQLAFNTAVTVLPHVNQGKLKPIAISTKERFPPLPDLQTVAEGGVKGFDGSSWQAVVMAGGHAARDRRPRLPGARSHAQGARDARAVSGAGRACLGNSPGGVRRLRQAGSREMGQGREGRRRHGRLT